MCDATMEPPSNFKGRIAMFTVKPGYVTFLLLSLLFTGNWMFESGKHIPWLQSGQAASEQAATKLPVRKIISTKELGKYKLNSVVVDEDGKQVKYKGVSLRLLLSEMLPEVNLDTMQDWKTIARQELVMEVTGDDGYPGLATALEVAMNKSGEQFLLATHKDGKLIESGVQLVCKSDEAHARWVHQIVLLRLVAVPKASDAESKQNAN